MKLFFREQGEGKPVIILHGLFGSSDNWLTVTKKIAETHKVYLIDQRNHGRSPHSEDFSYAAMAADLLEFITDHRIENPVLIGHSMGGKTVMHFAMKHPEKVGKLIVVDMSPRYYPLHHDAILEGLTTLHLAELTSRQEADQHLARHIPEPDVRQFLLKNLYRDENQKFAWRMNLPVIDRDIEQIGQAVPEDKKFEKETLFIKGGKSRYVQASDEALIKKLFPSSRIATIETAGHWVQAEAPEAFLGLVLDFIGS